MIAFARPLDKFDLFDGAPADLALSRFHSFIRFSFIGEMHVKQRARKLAVGERPPRTKVAPSRGGLKFAGTQIVGPAGMVVNVVGARARPSPDLFASPRRRLRFVPTLCASFRITTSCPIG